MVPTCRYLRGDALLAARCFDKDKEFEDVHSQFFCLLSGCLGFLIYEHFRVACDLVWLPHVYILAWF